MDHVAALEHLTGPARGTVSWMFTPSSAISLGEDGLVEISDDAASRTDDGCIATLLWAGDAYSIEASEGCEVWVNGNPVTVATLKHGDMIELGETGPMSRFRVFKKPNSIRWSIDDMIGDSIAYLRASRKPLGSRITRAAGNFGHRLVWETTIFFRVTMIAAVVALGALVYSQYQKTAELQKIIERDTARLEGVAAALAQAREEALRPSDLTALRHELGERMSSSVERLEALERQSTAAARVIAQSVSAVAFLQGAYGLRHKETGQMLRHVVSADGIPIISPMGQPLLSLKGDGPIAEVQFTGTAFLLRGSDLLITNRHVAMPWEGRTDPERLATQGMEPVILKFICFFPNETAPTATELVVASDVADLAVLRLPEPPAGHTGLAIAEAPPAPGEEVLVMGYPTGLRSMLAQSGAEFIEELQEEKDTDFWSVAERLARTGRISPLASLGIVGKVGGAAIVYDAETTHGGSGGPVLDMNGNVIAVNAAILPEFGGSNLGVPASELRKLLERAEAER